MGSPTKTKMAEEAKATSQIAMLAMAATVAIVLLFLTKPLQYMPNAVLSAVVFVIGIKLVDIANMRSIYRLGRSEFWIAALTAAVVVGVGVEQGIIVAIVLSVLLHVKRHYGPTDAVVSLDGQGRPVLSPPTPGTVSEPGLVVYRFSVGLFYANAARFSEEILALVDTDEPPRWLILLADGIDDIDYTGSQTVLETANQLSQRSIAFGIADVTDHVRQELDRFGITDKIGEDHYYASLGDAFAAYRAAT